MASAVGYKRPITDSGIAKFVHKDPENPNTVLAVPFENVWEAATEQELYAPESRQEISHDALKVGGEVLIEYTMTLYSGKELITPKSCNSSGIEKPSTKTWSPGCTLVLLSVGKCCKEDCKERKEREQEMHAFENYDFSSPLKRKRFG
jgi:hypothetical protein